MLYRFREAQAAELGLISKKKEKRPGMASSVNTIGECEKWRRQILSEISRKVTKIQDGKIAIKMSVLVGPDSFSQWVYLTIKYAISTTKSISFCEKNTIGKDG